jgi:hypothetical protein
LKAFRLSKLSRRWNKPIGDSWKDCLALKILLDHCVPKTLKYELPEHEVNTAREMGWEALKNGRLLEQAEANGFEVVITVDRNIRHQQVLARRSVAVCVMLSSGITIEDLRPLVPALEHFLQKVQTGKYYEIEYLGIRES